MIKLSIWKIYQNNKSKLDSFIKDNFFDGTSGFIKSSFTKEPNRVRVFYCYSYIQKVMEESIDGSINTQIIKHNEITKLEFRFDNEVTLLIARAPKRNFSKCLDTIKHGFGKNSSVTPYFTDCVRCFSAITEDSSFKLLYVSNIIAKRVPQTTLSSLDLSVKGQISLSDFFEKYPSVKEKHIQKVTGFFLINGQKGQVTLGCPSIVTITESFSNEVDLILGAIVSSKIDNQLN